MMKLNDLINRCFLCFLAGWLAAALTVPDVPDFVWTYLPVII